MVGSWPRGSAARLLQIALRPQAAKAPGAPVLDHPDVRGRHAIPPPPEQVWAGQLLRRVLVAGCKRVRTEADQIFDIERLSLARHFAAVRHVVAGDDMREVDEGADIER